MKKLAKAIAMLSIAAAVNSGSLAYATSSNFATGNSRQNPTVEVKTSVHPIVPVWLKGYRTGVRYYYFPDLEVYYDVNTGNYVYWGGADWVYATTLPGVYGGIDLASTHYVALDYVGLHPEHYIVTHLRDYPVVHRVTVTGVRYYDVDKKVVVEKPPVKKEKVEKAEKPEKQEKPQQ